MTLMYAENECCCFKVFFFFVILLFPSVVPQTTVILNNDRQNAIVAKMDDPLSGRAPESLENVISKSVATTPAPSFTATATEMSPLENQPAFRAGHSRPQLSVVGEGRAVLRVRVLTCWLEERTRPGRGTWGCRVQCSRALGELAGCFHGSRWSLCPPP